MLTVVIVVLVLPFMVLLKILSVASDVSQNKTRQEKRQQRTNAYFGLLEKVHQFEIEQRMAEDNPAMYLMYKINQRKRK